MLAMRIIPEQNTQSFSNYTSETSQTDSVIPSRQTSSPARSQAHFNTSSNESFAAAQRSQAAARRKSPPGMNGLLGNAPQASKYVRALYDYEADDRTSLSFHEGDVIEVITQLESGWWDGVINGVRGWFPSNYCQVIANPDDAVEDTQDGSREHTDDEDDESEEIEDYEDPYGEEDGDSELDDNVQPTNDGASNLERTRADFWIPQATPDGRLFYFNTETGESSMELPLESPSSATENGPRNRMNVDIPDNKTRPPPEMMSGGYMKDEDDESDGNSASELEGESLMLDSRNSLVMI